LLFKLDAGFKDCEWVAKKPDERCAEDGVTESCVATCTDCGTSTPTASPTASPTDEPTASPTNEATASPTDEANNLQCDDSELRYKAFTLDDEMIKAKCKDNTPDQCDIPGVSGHCRDTCSACGCYDSSLLFKVDVGFRDCEWVAEKPDERCAEDGVTESCVSTCTDCLDL